MGGELVMSKPTFGHTKLGHAVHAHTADYHKAGGFNKAIAMALTARVGSMRCFWAFCVLALLSLPATLHLANVVGSHWLGIPAFFLSYGFIFLDAWLCQNFIQLVLLPALMVGQNLQTEASDARAAKQFEDTETIADRLDVNTQGGITDVLQETRAVREDLAAMGSTLRSILGQAIAQADANAQRAADTQVRAGAGSNPAEGLTAEGAKVPPAAARKVPRPRKGEPS